MILPYGVDSELYTCDEACDPAKKNDRPEKEEDDEKVSSPYDKGMWTRGWYEHVLPQLRRNSWFGRKIVEAIQVRVRETAHICRLNHATYSLQK